MNVDAIIANNWQIRSLYEKWMCYLRRGLLVILRDYNKKYRS